MDAQQTKEPIVRISYDEMEAYLLLPPLSSGDTYSLEEVKQAVQKAGVKAGIDEAVLASAVENCSYGREILFARGMEPVNGKDGFYEYKFNTNFDHKPTLKPDGSVDYWSVHSVEIVEEGQVIATYTEPIEGLDGYTVSGKPKLAQRGRPAPPLVGQGFERSADGREYISKLTGKIDMKNDRIMIQSVYEVSGNVDLATGNIDFRGDVIIHGNVTTGARIKATGNITIDGTAEGCNIEAGKDIILRGGMIGGEKASIKAKGNITAKFIEYSTVEAEGTIEASSAMNSTIVGYDRIFFRGKNATVVGGTVYGCAGIETDCLGNGSELHTEVCVGVHKRLLQRLLTLQKEIEDITSMIEKINLGIKQFDELGKERNVDMRNDERRVALLRARIAKQAELAKHKEEMNHLQFIVEKSKGATVKVIHTVYPGVEVSINDAKIRIPSANKGVEFILRNEKVAMVALLD